MFRFVALALLLAISAPSAMAQSGPMTKEELAYAVKLTKADLDKANDEFAELTKELGLEGDQFETVLATYRTFLVQLRNADAALKQSRTEENLTRRGEALDAHLKTLASLRTYFRTYVTKTDYDIETGKSMFEDFGRFIWLISKTSALRAELEMWRARLRSKG